MEDQSDHSGWSSLEFSRWLARFRGDTTISSYLLTYRPVLGWDTVSMVFPKTDRATNEGTINVVFIWCLVGIFGISNS